MGTDGRTNERMNRVSFEHLGHPSKMLRPVSLLYIIYHDLSLGYPQFKIKYEKRKAQKKGRYNKEIVMEKKR